MGSLFVIFSFVGFPLDGHFGVHLAAALTYGANLPFAAVRAVPVA